MSRAFNYDIFSNELFLRLIVVSYLSLLALFPDALPCGGQLDDELVVAAAAHGLGQGRVGGVDEPAVEKTDAKDIKQTWKSKQK